MTLLKLYISALLLFSLVSTAQTVTEPERCLAKAPKNGNPSSASKEQTAELALSDALHTIPVVVHVLHLGEPVGEGTNISIERIESQIRVINEDFRRKEGTRGFNTHPAGGDAGIEFVLAKSTPDNKATNGIVRVDVSNGSPLPTNKTVNDNQAQYSYWNPEHYLNIWSTPDFRANQFLGYAKFPASNLPGMSPVEEPDADGVTVNAHHFGEITTTNYNFGRTATHEIGHYLGLLHVWGSGGSGANSCQGADDFCGDTPPVATSTSGCPAAGKLACDGQIALIENYLDYSYDRCMNIFTQDQIARMRYVLQTSPNRKSLVTSPGLVPPTSLSLASSNELNSIKFAFQAGEVRIDFPFSLPPNAKVTCFSITGTPLQEVFVTATSESQLVVRLPQSREEMLFLRLTGDRIMMVKKIVLN